MSTPAYRFLPWARRGMAAAITQPDVPASPARATITVGITVTGAGDAGTQLSLYGPGDIVGVDPRLIIRLEPRASASDVEPNYVAAIEFDPPDFPWLFTPATAAGQQLRPWCVLVVVDSSVVGLPHLERGAPLPVIDVPRGLMLTELPDLAESWAWAHTQLLTAQATPDALRGELNGAPDRNLSRIVSPRRLEPGRRYCACLVPAFAVGVTRGLGGAPGDDATLAPAWSLPSNTDLRLPVYFHWEFATGPQGDFESLARQLKPFKVDADAGIEKMFVGDADPGMPALDPNDPALTMDQDGALRAPLAGSGTLADVSPAITTGLRNILEAASAQLEGEGTSALGPPLYAQWPTNRHTIEGDVPEWFEELNVDPRARVAAGLGAEIVRVHQEAFMEVCWNQVGKVLDANEALSRARLALEAARRVHERHFKAVPADVLTQLASPLHARVRLGAVTVRRALADTSVPDATTDAAMRRATSGQRPFLKKAARRRGDALPPSLSARPLLARSLAAGRQDVDPGRFTPGGVLDLEFLSQVPSPSGTATTDLTPFGVPMRLNADQLQLLNTRFAELSAVPTKTAPPIIVRTNLQTTGLLTGAQLTQVAVVTTPTPTTIVDRRALLDDVLVASVTQPGAVSFLITVGNRSGQTRVDALDVDSGGSVVIRPPIRTEPIFVGTVSSSLARTPSARLTRAIASLPPNSLDRRGVLTPELVPADATTDPPLISNTGTLVLGDRVANTVEPPTRDPVILQRFEAVFNTASSALQLSSAEPAPVLVGLSLAAVRGTILDQTDPELTVRLRTAARVRVAGQRLDALVKPNLTVAPTFDRIMVAPSIATPLYELLAQYDRTRLLPGVDRIPDDAITLLETNARFVSAFLAGANHEMNRELLWRRYPTDQRGTTLRRFWDWLDGGDDVPAMHTWNPSGILGSHARGGGEGLLVLLVRGKLLRRYPNSVVYAWRAVGRLLKDPPAASDLRAPVFSGFFAPDVTFVGFDLTFEEITQGDGWFFVIQEQPTEPRFGFDEFPPAVLAVPPSWSDATWSDLDVAPGRHLTLAGNPLAGTTRNGATLGVDAAHLAAVLLQKPMRVALHGSQLAQLR
jgi:hypothetical protein